MSRKTNRLKDRIRSLELRLESKAFMLKRARIENEDLDKENGELEAELNKLRSFGVHNRVPGDTLETRIAISIRSLKSVKSKVDYIETIFNGMRHNFINKVLEDAKTEGTV